MNRENYTQAHQDFDKAISLEKNSAKLYHAKGLAYQSNAENLALKGDIADIEKEDTLV